MGEFFWFLFFILAAVTDATGAVTSPTSPAPAPAHPTPASSSGSVVGS